MRAAWKGKKARNEFLLPDNYTPNRILEIRRALHGEAELCEVIQ